MKVEIFAEDKPAEKVFEYKLEVVDKALLLSTAILRSDCSSQLIFSLERHSTASIFL